MFFKNGFTSFWIHKVYPCPKRLANMHIRQITLPRSLIKTTCISQHTLYDVCRALWWCKIVHKSHDLNSPLLLSIGVLILTLNIEYITSLRMPIHLSFLDIYKYEGHVCLQKGKLKRLWYLVGMRPIFFVHMISMIHGLNVSCLNFQVREISLYLATNKRPQCLRRPSVEVFPAMNQS